MKFEYIKYNVIQEEDFIEDGHDLIKTVIQVTFRVIQEENSKFIIPEFNEQIIVINNNQQTGYEMDAQRIMESIQFVESL